MKRWVFALLEWKLGILARMWVRLFGTSAGLVLAYHSISDSPWIHAIPPEMFEKQLAWLSSACALVPLSTMQEIAAERTRRVRQPQVTITFDDGYQDWIERAAPLLRAHSIPATFFVTTSFSSVTSEPQSGLAPLCREDVRYLADKGYEIGSHSHTHRDLSACSREELQDECDISRKILQDLSGQEVTRFSYPKGRYAKENEDMLQKTGFVVACTGHGRVQAGTSLLRLPRLPVTKVLPLWQFKARVYRIFAWG